MNFFSRSASAVQADADWRRALFDALALGFTLACGVVTTLYVFDAVESTQQRQRQEQFTAVGQSVVDSFYLDLVRSVEAVRATALMVSNQPRLTRDDFDRFAQGIMTNAPTLSSLQWQPTVRGIDLASFEAAARKQGMPGYRVVWLQAGQTVPVVPKAQHLPILYASPQGSAQLGLDLSQIEQRMESKLLAQVTGQPVASATFSLISGQQDGDKSSGVVISSAVLRSANQKGDAQHALGFVGGVIQVETLFREAAFRAEAAAMDMMVFDQASEPRKLVFSAFSEPDKVANAVADTSDATRFDVRLTVDAASRPWEVVLRPRPQFLAGQSRRDSHLVLWGCGSATVLLMLAMFVTQRSRRITAALQASSMAAERRLGHIIDGTQAGTWEWHVPSGQRLINERWATMLGYSAVEVADRNNTGWIELMHPADRAQNDERMQAHLRGEAVIYESEFRLRHKQGYWVWVLSRAALVSRSADGKPEWVAGTHLDISESKRVVQQMADVRTALDAHAIVGITDANGAITYANDKFCDVSQYPRTELMGQDHRILNSGWHTQAFFAAMWDTITHGKAWRGEIRNRAKDGHFYWVDTTIAPILDEGGLPEQYIAIRYDITDQKDNAASLQEAKESAETASRAKSDFLATMSHEIRTPMNGILGMLKLLQHTDLTTRQLDYTRKADGATQALLGIINDILDFSKVEAGKLELDPTHFVLGDVLRDLSVVLSSNLGNKDIEVLFSIEPQVPQYLWGDALRLRQVLLNLSGNAIKFTEHGHVVLRVNLVVLNSDTAAIEFSVQDSGIGIASDKLEYIFEGFSQAESTTTRRFGGTGLGLAISKRLVAAMGGDLQVQSQPGVGSRFSFTLCFPLSEAQHNALRTPLVCADSGKALRVLVVDDSALARDVLLGMVVSMGWECTCQDSGQAALQHLADAHTPAYDLILMDWRMPELDGWETTRRIRALQNGGLAPVVIMVTAAGRESLAAKPKAETDMLDGYLVKPVTASMLFDAVTEATATRSGQPDGRARHQHPKDSGHRLAGLRLLVVEDNLLNQQVAQELLERNGATIEIASGGIDGVAQALDAQPPFDAILMDMQMPDIDGLEATRRIRSIERMRSVPIIAMTANAMQSDKDDCLAAGMVDHVGKPIDLEVLIATILRHTSVNGRRFTEPFTPIETVRVDKAEGVTGATGLIDLHAAVERMGGNRAFFNKIAQAFRTDAAAQLAALAKQIDQNDPSAALRSTHTFKGLAATVGASALARLAAQTELEIKALDLSVADGQEKSRQLLQSLEMLFAKVLQELETITQDVSSVQPPTPPSQKSAPLVAPDTQAYTQLLQSLGAMLKTGNMQAGALCQEIRQDYAPALDTRFDALEDSVNRLDFAQASTQCTNLLAELDRPQ